MASIRTDIGQALDEAEDLAQDVLNHNAHHGDRAKLAEAILLLLSILRLAIRNERVPKENDDHD